MTSAAPKVSRPRAVWDRSASDSRLLPKSSPNIVSLLNTPSGDGRSLNSNRLAFLRNQHSRTGAPPRGRTYLAGKVNAGQAEEPGYFRLRAIQPIQDPLLVTIREIIYSHHGFESMLPAFRVVECHWWTGKPHTETFSCLVHLINNPWGCRRGVVDANGIGADVAAFLPKNPGPSIAFPSLPSLVGAFPANHALSPHRKGLRLFTHNSYAEAHNGTSASGGQD